MNVVSTKHRNDESKLEDDSKMGNDRLIEVRSKLNEYLCWAEFVQTLGEPLILNQFIESGEADKGRAAARVDWGHIKGGSYHDQVVHSNPCPLLRPPLWRQQWWGGGGELLRPADCRPWHQWQPVLLVLPRPGAGRHRAPRALAAGGPGPLLGGPRGAQAARAPGAARRRREATTPWAEKEPPHMGQETKCNLHWLSGGYRSVDFI